MSTSKEIHFYVYPMSSAVNSYRDTEEAINNGDSRIDTLQMGLLSGRLFELGYRIFVHEAEDDWYEIKLGCENERTVREIRIAHNLFKMWRAGKFSRAKG